MSVASTSLESVSYSPDKCLLQLQFRDGAVYRYFDVPLERYRELLTADSKGVYFNRYIRNQYHFQEVARQD